MGINDGTNFCFEDIIVTSLQYGDKKNCCGRSIVIKGSLAIVFAYI